MGCKLVGDRVSGETVGKFEGDFVDGLSVVNQTERPKRERAYLEVREQAE